jgi:hypothetical protein
MSKRTKEFQKTVSLGGGGVDVSIAGQWAPMVRKTLIGLAIDEKNFANFIDRYSKILVKYNIFISWIDDNALKTRLMR